MTIASVHVAIAELLPADCGWLREARCSMHESMLGNETRFTITGRAPSGERLQFGCRISYADTAATGSVVELLRSRLSTLLFREYIAMGGVI